MTERWLQVRNWDTFQHYRDRSPVWIKLYVGLLEDYQFGRLSPDRRCLLLHVWIVAAKLSNKIPWDIPYIRRLMALDFAESDLEALVESQWLTVSEVEPAAVESPWPSRAIPPAIKAIVRKRDKGRCVYCQAKDHLEFDHVIPVSRGGISTDASNVQLLCRSCNRSKRVRIDTEAEPPATHRKKDVERVATQVRSLEERREDPLPWKSDLTPLRSYLDGSSAPGGRDEPEHPEAA